MALGIMTLNKMTLVKVTLGKMTLCKMALSKMDLITIAEYTKMLYINGRRSKHFERGFILYLVIELNKLGCLSLDNSFGQSNTCRQSWCLHICSVYVTHTHAIRID